MYINDTRLLTNFIFEFFAVPHLTVTFFYQIICQVRNMHAQYSTILSTVESSMTSHFSISEKKKSIDKLTGKARICLSILSKLCLPQCCLGCEA